MKNCVIQRKKNLFLFSFSLNSIDYCHCWLYTSTKLFNLSLLLLHSFISIKISISFYLIVQDPEMVLSMTRMWNCCWSSTYTHDILSKYNFQAGHYVSFDSMKPCRSQDTATQNHALFWIILVSKTRGSPAEVRQWW